MGDEHTLVHELIGGAHPAGGWQMHAFGQEDNPDVMRLNQEDTDTLLLQGDGVRSWFHISAGDGYLTTQWEREVDGIWLRWMDMRFERM